MGAVAMVNCPTAIPPCSRGTASINVAIATSIVLQRFAEWAASRGDWVPNTVIPNRLVCGLGKFSVQEVPSVDYEEQRALGERVCQERLAKRAARNEAQETEEIPQFFLTPADYDGTLTDHAS
eukprot:GHVN01099327.1.p1 GENE.GHVN01099327.1~~GHVN01099327.1.p1  ORF type:complete len:123 (-),score=15.94 GHVN01099327.1:349-717(-)